MALFRLAASSAREGAPSGGFSTVNEVLREPGEPLDGAVRSYFEPRMAQSLEGVRLHRGALATRSADDVGARAFTAGQHIVVRDGHYAPSTEAGQRLLAHELAHVAQSSRGPVAPAGTFSISQPGDVAERDADRMAGEMSIGGPPTVAAPRSHAPAGVLHRAPPADDADPFDYFAYEDKGWWWHTILVQNVKPTIAEARAVMVAAGFADAGALSESTLSFVQNKPGLYSYWCYRHPTKGAVARVYISEVGWDARLGTLHGASMFLHESQLAKGDKDGGGVVVSGVDRSSKDREKSGRLVGAAARDETLKKLPKEDQQAINDMADRIFWERTDYKKGTKLGSSKEDKQLAKVWMDVRDELLIDLQKIQALPPEVRSVLFGSTGPVPKPEQMKQVLRIAEKIQKVSPNDRAFFKLGSVAQTLDQVEKQVDSYLADPSKAPMPPEDLEKLFKALEERTGGRPFTGDPNANGEKLRRFLQQKKDKVDKIVDAAPKGRLTPEKVQQIASEYDKFVAEEKDSGPEQLDKLEDFDKHFKQDPAWAKLSPEDRKLLVEYSKLAPDEITDDKINFTRVTTDMKVSMALKLSYKSWPAEIAEAAKAAFTDPAFLITLVLLIGIYVGLWLTPEPTMITKIAAGTLTVVLLAQFAWEDIIGLARAWMTLNDDCKAANDVAHLKAAGEKFAKKVGQVGFDILMFIAMWGLGKAAGPKISKIGTARNTARAQAKVTAAESKPGSGVAAKVTPEGAKVIETARTKAGGSSATPAQVLDALAAELPANAKAGLEVFRGKLGDVGALKALEARLAKGEAIDHFLADQSLTPQARATVRAEVLEARVRLARAKLIELGVNKDPVFRRALDAETKRLAEKLKTEKVADDAAYQKALESFNVNELVGEMAESMARQQLAAELPSGKSYRILSNMELVREVPGYKTIAEWKAAQPDPAKADIGGLYVAEGKLWKSITEVDSMVVEPKGKQLRPVLLEQVKSGKGDSHAAANAQNAAAKQALIDIAQGKTDVQIFDRPGKNTLGKRRTGEFDLSGVDTVPTQTRGLPGKGFDKPLELGTDKVSAEEGRGILEKLVRSLLQEGLPSFWIPALPPSGSHDKDKP